MVRLAAELLLLLGLLLLTLHITVLRSSPLPQGNVTRSLDQDTEVSEEQSRQWRRAVHQGSFLGGGDIHLKGLSRSQMGLIGCSHEPR